MVRHRIPLAIAATLVSAFSLAGPAVAADREAGPVGQAIQPIEAAPPGTNCRVIDFKTAEVVTSQTVPPRHVLVVRGEKPYLNMQVDLVPRTYIRQPEYWGIEVVGCLPEMGAPAVESYVVQRDLDGAIGTRGIEVVGANRSEKIDIPGVSR